jgi:hypothetical protein
MNPVDIQMEAEKISGFVKEHLRIRPMDKYKKEIILTDYLDSRSIDVLHLSCDCFVTASFGEAWCLPAQDANTAGNIVIGTQHGIEIQSTPEPCTGVFDTFNNVLTGKDYWLNPSITSLRSLMRHAFEGKLKRKFVDCTNNYEELFNE